MPRNRIRGSGTRCIEGNSSETSGKIFPQRTVELWSKAQRRGSNLQIQRASALGEASPEQLARGLPHSKQGWTMRSHPTCTTAWSCSPRGTWPCKQLTVCGADMVVGAQRAQRCVCPSPGRGTANTSPSPGLVHFIQPPAPQLEGLWGYRPHGACPRPGHGDNWRGKSPSSLFKGSSCLTIPSR